MVATGTSSTINSGLITSSTPGPVFFLKEDYNADVERAPEPIGSS